MKAGGKGGREGGRALTYPEPRKVLHARRKFKGAWVDSKRRCPALRRDDAADTSGLGDRTDSVGGREGGMMMVRHDQERSISFDTQTRIQAGNVPFI